MMRVLSRIVSLALALGAIDFHATRAHAGSDGGVVVLCHVTNPVGELSGSDLKKALTGGTKQWPNGAIVQVGLTSPDSREVGALAAAAGMNAPELLGRIQQQVFKGEMRRPVMLRSTAECIGLARVSPGAICAIASGSPLPPQVKVIAVR